MATTVEEALIRRQSLFQKTTTMELPGVEPMMFKDKTLAVFTSGGDAQGMNAAVRAIVRIGMYMGCKVYLIYEGYQGMVDGGDYLKLASWDTVSGIMKLGGTVIGSARCKDFREREGRMKAAHNLVERGINNLICIGGDGSLTGANEFKREWSDLISDLLKDGKIKQDQADACKKLNLVGLVGSIDNDFCGTDMTIGADSALHRIIEAVDNISPTADSHQRCFVLEVMGRHCGYLALVGGLAAEADWLFIPEWPPEEGWEDKLCERLSKERELGCRLNIIIVAEGAMDRNGNEITAEKVKDLITEKVHLDTRVTVLGHIQRGGNPSAFDRIVASRMGVHAVLALFEHEDDDPESYVIVTVSNEIKRVSLVEAVARTREVATKMGEKNFVEAVQLRGKSFQNNLEVHVMMSKDMPDIDSNSSKILGLLNAGELACGMNAAARAVVRKAANHGYRVLGIRNGFEGLINKQIMELTWKSVTGWTCIGGAEIGASKIIFLSLDLRHTGLSPPYQYGGGLLSAMLVVSQCQKILFALGETPVVSYETASVVPRYSKKVTPDKIGFKKIAEALNELQLKGLMIIGGFEAFYSALGLLEMRKSHKEFDIPITVLPATIYNNMPGTDLTVGADTALNQIRDVCDKLNIAARATSGQVFVVETFGDHCGYLATMSALLSGADTVYIPEEQASIMDIQVDATQLTTKMKSGVTKGLVIKSNMSHDLFTADFITRLYADVGRDTFSAKPIIIGEMQSLHGSLGLKGLSNSLSTSNMYIQTVSVFVCHRLNFGTEDGVKQQKYSGFRPSAFDRITATKMGVRCAEKLISQIEKKDGGETCTLIGIRHHQEPSNQSQSSKTTSTTSLEWLQTTHGGTK